MRSGMRQTYSARLGLPAEAEPLYLEAEGIYRQQGEEAELDLANTLRGLALVNGATGRAAASSCSSSKRASYTLSATWRSDSWQSVTKSFLSKPRGFLRAFSLLL